MGYLSKDNVIVFNIIIEVIKAKKYLFSIITIKANWIYLNLDYFNLKLLFLDDNLRGY